MAVVLVTGAAGAVGTPVAAALKAAGHDVRGFDRRGGEHVTHAGELTDAAAVDAAVEGCDVVIHLAACPDEADFVTEIVPPNVIGLYRVFDACARFGVRKLAVASSLRAAGRWDGDAPVPVTAAAPGDFYALSKLWAEEMAALYSRRQGLSVVAVRIGWLPRNAGDAERIRKNGGGRNIYLSHDDAGRFFVACVDALLGGLTGCHVLYATSRPFEGRERLDLQPSRDAIGYEPRDVFPEGLSFPFDG